jgi:hypothetical protein
MKINIPPAAWKAAMVAYHSSVKLGPDEAWQAACLAMLTAWPGVDLPKIENAQGCIFLPLPKEGE